MKRVACLLAVACAAQPPRLAVGDDPDSVAQLVAALRATATQRVALAPSGEATLEPLGTVGATHGYALAGLDLDPIFVGLDGRGKVVAQLDFDGDGPLAAGDEALRRATVDALTRRAARIAARFVRPPHGLVIRHARLFDPRTLDVRDDATIVIGAHTIVEVGDATLSPPPGAQQIDAHGRFVMPGLWDSHLHLFAPSTAILALAAGITTVRDMGNERDLPSIVRRFDAGTDLGPRVVMAVRVGRFIDGEATGIPQVTSLDDARALVDRYAARGYAQVKVLDGIDPAWPPVLAALAHARGLRFSGHLPTAMTPHDFFAAGADELQHVHFLLRGVAPPAVDDTVRARIAELAARHITLDATLAQFEPAPRVGALAPIAAAILPRLPPRAASALARDVADPAQHARSVARWPVLREIVRRAHAAGVVIVPGSDGLPAGFGLRRELALYGELGIPAAEVLAMATYGAARNMHREDRSGSLAPGKDADLVMIDGDPTRDLGALARVSLVIKDGVPLAPAALERLVSLAPAR